MTVSTESHTQPQPQALTSGTAPRTQPCPQPWGAHLSPSPMPTCSVIVPSLQIPRRLHKDIKEPLQVRGASAVLGVELHTAGPSGEAQPHAPSPAPG